MKDGVRIRKTGRREGDMATQGEFRTRESLPWGAALLGDIWKHARGRGLSIRHWNYAARYALMILD